MRRLPLFIVPLGVIVVLLLMRFSPMLAAFWAILTAIALSLIDKETRPTVTELANCIAKGAMVGAKIGVSLCVVGMISQTLVTTGLGSKIAGLVEALSGGNVLIAIPLILLSLTAAIYNTGLCKLNYIERVLCLLSTASLLFYCTIHNLNSMFMNLTLLLSGVAAFAVVLAGQMKKTKATLL